jgi:hypothetical protein
MLMGYFSAVLFWREQPMFRANIPLPPPIPPPPPAKNADREIRKVPRKKTAKKYPRKNPWLSLITRAFDNNPRKKPANKTRDSRQLDYLYIFFAFLHVSYKLNQAISSWFKLTTLSLEVHIFGSVPKQRQKYHHPLKVQQNRMLWNYNFLDKNIKRLSL